MKVGGGTQALFCYAGNSQRDQRRSQTDLGNVCLSGVISVILSKYLGGHRLFRAVLGLSSFFCKQSS